MLATCLLAAALVAATPSSPAAPPTTVERWGVFEAELAGPRDGNPYADVQLRAMFSQGADAVVVSGFYDGDGVYRVRFSPDREGTWQWTTASNRPELDGKRGTIKVVKASPGNHGPVRVRDKTRFAYADGTPYHPVGTTVYALPHPPEAVEQRTLAALAASPFNKVRLCVFPKWYTFNRTEPLYAPFERRADGRFDVFRPNPAFYRHLERRIVDLQKLGIEADLILFHPYDEGHWGFDRMGRDADQQYLRYVVARLGAFRNVWWAMANEWDLVKRRTVYDWNQLFDILEKEDGHRRLCSIHNGAEFFDHARRPITHVSVQNHDPGRVPEWEATWRKPVVVDECEYEGDIVDPWGNLSGEELVHRFWQGFIRGGYVGHGETFRAPDDVLWWGKGGDLRGASPARIRFLRDFIEKEGELSRVASGYFYPIAKQRDSYVVYFGRHAPRYLNDDFTAALGKNDPKLTGARWRFEVIDPWAMSRTPVTGEFSGKFEVPLPGRMYLVVKATPVPGKMVAAKR